MPIRGTRSSSIHNTGPSPSTRKPSKGTAVAAKSLQSCLTLCDSIDGSPLGFSVPGVLQAIVLEWVAIAFSIPVCPLCPGGKKSRCLPSGRHGGL